MKITEEQKQQVYNYLNLGCILRINRLGCYRNTYGFFKIINGVIFRYKTPYGNTWEIPTYSPYKERIFIWNDMIGYDIIIPKELR